MEKQEIVTSSLANLVSDIKEIINKGRREAYSEVNAVMISTYWKIGRRIVTEEQNGQKRAEYGKGLIDALARELTHDMGEGYSPRYLRAFRKFYTLFPDEENWKSRFPNLTWTHIFQTLRVDDDVAIRWYLTTASQEMWSTRALDRNISTQYYERHYVQPSLPLPNSEKTDKLELLIRTDTQDYYIDLVFYNVLLKCYVLVDLKVGKITHQDVGQMDMYVRMYDELKRTEGDNPTIGIVLCSETSKDIARYSILKGNEQIFATKYKLYLPTQEELRREIEQQKQFFLMQQDNKGKK